MIYRNGIYYDRMIRNGVEYDRMVRNGVAYGKPGQPPSPESFRALYSTDAENTSPWGYYEFLPEGYDNAPQLPMLVYLGSLGTSGDGTNGVLQKVLGQGIGKLCNEGRYHENMVTLSPQWLDDANQNWYNEGLLFDFIAYAKQKYRVDSSRIYLTGCSAGAWYITYYLEKLPATHGIAAAVPISAVLEDGYTTADGVAASDCPQWWMGSIHDDQVPWDDSGSVPWNYVPVVDSVAAINASNPGLAILTGFDDDTHEGSWEGIYSGSLIGQADPEYDPFDRPIYDWLLAYELES